MKHILFILLTTFCTTVLGCGKAKDSQPNPPINGGGGSGGTSMANKRTASLGIVGDTSNVVRTVTAGLVLMGGGKDVDAAFKWMIDRSGGGDVLVIRASGTDAYNPYINGLGAVNSVETLLINTKELANNDTVAYLIRNAEMVFIAGGDQSDYMNFWKGTKVDKAINYLLTEKKAPVGGTSAGCAILGSLYYSGELGSVVSQEALLNPYDSKITLYNNDFLKAPFLQNVITDQHYLTRGREGRSMIFLGRILKDWNIVAKGIAVDERTAVCIDANGMAKVYGEYSTTSNYGNAYFLVTDQAKKPEVFTPNIKPTWNYAEKAVSVYEFTAAVDGLGKFNVASFNLAEATGGKAYWWFLDDGVLTKKLQ